MVDYREILRLNSQGDSQRHIAASVGSSRNTVNEMLTAAKTLNIKWPLDESTTNEVLQSILFPDKFSAESMYLEPNYAYIHKELAKPGVTMTLLWSEYNEHCINVVKRPYIPTQFGEKYKKVGVTHQSNDADSAQTRRCNAGRLGNM